MQVTPCSARRCFVLRASRNCGLSCSVPEETEDLGVLWGHDAVTHAPALFTQGLATRVDIVSSCSYFQSSASLTMGALS